MKLVTSWLKEVGLSKLIGEYDGGIAMYLIIKKNNPFSYSKKWYKCYIKLRVPLKIFFIDNFKFRNDFFFLNRCLTKF